MCGGCDPTASASASATATGSGLVPDHEMLNDIIQVTLKVFYILASIVYYYALAIPIVSIVSTKQEYKIWKRTPTPLTLLGITKVYLYNVIWMGLCLMASLALLPMWIQRGCGNSVSLEANAVFEKIISRIVQTMIIGPVEIVNPHNLPTVHLYPDTDTDTDTDTNGANAHGPAPVFIANHCSQIDCGAVYYVVKRFKWIAKKSVRIIPGAGNIMMLGAHIFIQRSGKNRGSVSNLYEQSNEAIQSGIPMLLFPQGTRRMNTKLPFKDGAFKIAIENESVICPITIHVPPGAWNTLYPLNILWGGHKDKESGERNNKVIMTVHEPIVVTKDMEIGALRDKCQEIIYSALPPLYHGQGHVDDGTKKKTKKDGDGAIGMDKKTK